MPITVSYSITNSGSDFSTADSCVADIKSHMTSAYTSKYGFPATNHAFNASTQTLTFDREFVDSAGEAELYDDSETMSSITALGNAGYNFNV